MRGESLSRLPVVQTYIYFNPATGDRLFSPRGFVAFLSRCREMSGCVTADSLFILPTRCLLFPSGFPTKTLYGFVFFLIRATCLAHLIVLGLVTQVCLLRSKNYDGPRCEVFGSHLLLFPS